MSQESGGTHGHRRGACAAAAVAGCGGSVPAKPPRSVSRFLAAYARPDGRVVRPDQGGDTVSEGQAYGLVLAEAAGDDDAFRRIWSWTRDHLQLPDGLFAFHANAAGGLISRQPASDADVLIAWALLRYGGPGAAAAHRAGRRVADAVLTRDGRLLPPDWAELTASGTMRPEPAPDGSQPQTQYGPDAQRTVAWFAASCSSGARALAARWWPMLRSPDRARALSLHPDGSVLNGTPAPLALVASAAAARAAGDGRAARQLLRGAAAVQHAHPTYYGGAWVALGAILLSTHRLGS